VPGRTTQGRLETANGGTVFLDEIGDLPLELQSKLLRFLEERRFERVGDTTTREVDVRIVAATNRDLEAEVRAGRFRQDLFYRLSVIGITLPPLRARPEDLPALIDHVLTTLGARHGRGAVAIEPGARAALLAYPWPGNVRELVNALERALVLSPGGTIRATELPDHVLAPGVAAQPAGGGGDVSLEELERRHVRACSRIPPPSRRRPPGSASTPRRSGACASGGDSTERWARVLSVRPRSSTS
jgi:transcriptional regulator with PAS, ATPase and Fis domain